MTGVRPDWMYAAACAAQRLAGEIAFGTASSVKVRDALTESTPTPTSEIESLLLDGLIARAEREARNDSQLNGGHGHSLPFRAIQLLQARHAHPWTNANLARELGTNKLVLTSQFRDAVGMGPHEYLVQVRLKEAERRIAEGCKVEAAAFEVGFRSAKTLYNVHRRVIGTHLNTRKLRDARNLKARIDRGPKA